MILNNVTQTQLISNLNSDFLDSKLPVFATKVYCPNYHLKRYWGIWQKWQTWLTYQNTDGNSIYSAWFYSSLSCWDNTSGSYLSFFIKTFLRMIFLRILLFPVIKEMISANVTAGANVIIGANGYTPFPDKKYFYVWESCTRRGTSTIICSLFCGQCIKYINVINI